MKTIVHYTATSQNTHRNPNNPKPQTTACGFNGQFKHVGVLSPASAAQLAARHTAKRGVSVVSVDQILLVATAD